MWYATEGEFQGRNTFYEGESNGKDTRWPKWFPNDYKGVPLKQGTEILIVAVARDYRGGTDWLAFRIKLGAPDPSIPTPESP